MEIEPWESETNEDRIRASLLAERMVMQVSGSKRFRIYPPGDAGNLYAYPVHHPLDQRARGAEVTLVHGPYSCVFPPLVYAMFGSCLHASVGSSWSRGRSSQKQANALLC